MLFDKCVCGKDGQTVVLLGGYRVCLCDTCGNEWAEYLLKSSEYEEYTMVGWLIHIAIRNPTTEYNKDLRILTQQEIQLSADLYYMAKTWVEERRAEFARDDNI